MRLPDPIFPVVVGEPLIDLDMVRLFVFSFLPYIGHQLDRCVWFTPSHWSPGSLFVCFFPLTLVSGSMDRAKPEENQLLLLSRRAHKTVSNLNFVNYLFFFFL